MSLAAYLNFPGNAREAMSYYANVFGTKTEFIMTYGEMPENPEYPLSDEMKGRVVNGRMHIAGSLIMFSDLWPGMEAVPGNMVNISVIGTDREMMERAFGILSQDGAVRMPLGETSWSPLYGDVVDKYGIHWQFNYDETLA
jgi:PhnB protein